MTGKKRNIKQIRLKKKTFKENINLYSPLTSYSKLYKLMYKFMYELGERESSCDEEVMNLDLGNRLSTLEYSSENNILTEFQSIPSILLFHFYSQQAGL